VRLDIRGLTFSYGDRPILRGVDLTASDSEIIAILGPNGAGKSTLFRCILGLLESYGGEVLLNNTDIRSLSRRELAEQAAYIPQSTYPVFNHTALEVVLMGLASRLGTLSAPKGPARERALSVMESLGIAHLRDRGWVTVSGGERQLILLARALAQDAPLLVMDEPTANLDYGHQHLSMARARVLAERGYTVLLSTHNPSHALQYASRVVVLKDGVLKADGVPRKVLTSELLSEIYEIPVVVGNLRSGGREILTCAPAEAGNGVFGTH
jgi:iron complex transport system ATP-binding protein